MYVSAGIPMFSKSSLCNCLKLLSLWILLSIPLQNALAAEADEVRPPEFSAKLAERNMRFVHVDTLGGLSQDTVMAVTQDNFGFIWIATEEGLNRYDGQKIEQFERDPFNENSLSHNWIFSLHVASDDKLWIGTDGGGVNIYNPLTEQFSALRHDPDDANSISSDRIRTLHQDRAGNYWVGTVDAGLNRIHGKTGEVTRFINDPDNPTSLPDNSILEIAEDRRGALWIGTDGGGLARFEPATSSFSRYQSQDTPHSLSGHKVSAILEDRDGSLWVGTRDAGLNRLDTATGTFQHFQSLPGNSTTLSSNFVRDILEDGDGTLWIATDDGLNEWRPSANGFARYYANDTDSTSLSVSRLTHLFQSSDGVLWVSSYRGVNTWNYLSDAFTHYRKGNGMLKDDTVTSIGESSTGLLWIGTYGGGLAGIDRQANRITHLNRESGNRNSLSSDRVMAIYVDANDVVWAGTRSRGLNSYDPRTGKFERLGTPELSGNMISAILGDTDGTLWVGTFGGGLNRIEPGTADRLRKITHFEHDPLDPSSLGGNRVLAITRDKEGVLWVGTESGGLNKFVPEQDGFERFIHNPIDSKSISSNTAWEITETSDGSLWVATKDDGLNQWRPEDRAAGVVNFVKWTKADGLRSNTVYGLLEDNIGQLWLSSNRGISRINLSNYEMRHYDRRNGLVGDEFNWGARFRSRMGQIIFGGNAGAVSFTPGQIRHNTRVPAAVVKAFSPFERLAVGYRGRKPDEPAQITYKDSYVAFEFAALDYTSPDKNEFRIMLEGFDTTWQDPEGVRRVTYANLSPGNYLFRVKVANSDGVWNENGGFVPLQVNPAPWQTGWAFVAYLSLFVLFVYAVLRIYRARRINESIQRERLEAQVSERTSELGERNRQLEDLNRRLLETSFTDSLTGLYNRRYLGQFIEKQIRSIDRESFAKRNSENTDYGRYQQNVLFFMMIDLDGFKAINDNYGHNAGDQALLQVRDELLGCMRTMDTVVRWGGDEFLVIGQTRGISGIANLAERVCLAVSEHVYEIGQGQTAYLSCSIGAVPYPFAPLKTELLGWEQSLNVADSCSYVVKANGRNGWLVLSGAEALTQAEALDLPNTMDRLSADGKVQITTSLKSPIDLKGNQKSVA